MMFSAVPKQVIDIVWDDVVKVLKPAVDTAKGKLGIKDIKEYLYNGAYELWVVMDGTKIVAAITTRIIDYPERRALAMDFIGGTRMKEWLPEGYGRKAWGRWLGKYGWEPDYIAYRMEING